MLKDLLLKTRSYRGYDESYKVSREELMEIVDLTRYTAASANVQPLKFALVTDHEKVEEILAMTKWAAALPQMHLPKDGKHPTAFIVICQDTNITDNDTLFLKDVGIAGQIISMAAAERGLGALMIGNFSPVKIRSTLGIPIYMLPKLVIALGKPDEEIVLVDAGKDGKTTYYRDENDVHYVPKRKLEDIVL